MAFCDSSVEKNIVLQNIIKEESGCNSSMSPEQLQKLEEIHHYPPGDRVDLTYVITGFALGTAVGSLFFFGCVLFMVSALRTAWFGGTDR